MVRRHQRDVEWLLDALRDLSDQQVRLFLLLTRFLSVYQPPDVHGLIDDDVSEAAGALAATYETALSGLIYEHRPASAPAERLAAALKPLVAEAGGPGGSAYERSAAAVLRRIEGAARSAREHDPGNRRAFLDLVARVVKPPSEARDGAAPEAPRLIVP